MIGFRSILGLGEKLFGEMHQRTLFEWLSYKLKKISNRSGFTIRTVKSNKRKVTRIFTLYLLVLYVDYPHISTRINVFFTFRRNFIPFNFFVPTIKKFFCRPKRNLCVISSFNHNTYSTAYMLIISIVNSSIWTFINEAIGY